MNATSLCVSGIITDFTRLVFRKSLQIIPFVQIKFLPGPFIYYQFVKRILFEWRGSVANNLIDEIFTSAAPSTFILETVNWEKTIK